MTESLFEFRISLQRFRDVQYGLNSDLQVRRLNSFMHKKKKRFLLRMLLANKDKIFNRKLHFLCSEKCVIYLPVAV